LVILLLHAKWTGNRTICELSFLQLTTTKPATTTVATANNKTVFFHFVLILIINIKS